jgi:transcriptional regulator with XRE-family HTH domain
MRLQVAEVARRNKGWNMRKLADKLHIEHQTVMYWNQGRAYPRLPMLVKLCRLLGCTFEELLVEEGDECRRQDNAAE